MTVAIAALATICAALIISGVTLYVGRLNRKNVIEERHAAAREEAFNQLVAAGDVAWLVRTEVGDEDADIIIPEHDKVGHEANQLFQLGFDRLKEHATNFESERPFVVTWYKAAFEDSMIGPQTFEIIRDQFSNRRRLETGLRKRLASRDRPLLERLTAREIPQRMPSGLQQIVYDDQGGFIAEGGGDGFLELLLQAATPHK